MSKTGFKKGNKFHLLADRYRTDSTRKKISEKLIGNKNGLGHKMSDANKKKISILHSKPKSEEHKRKISETMTGVPLEVGRAKRLRKYLQTYNTGSNNPAWRGGVSKINKAERQLLMEKPEYKFWREANLKRDNYTCIWGGKEHGSKLNVDHIKSWAEYPDLRYAIDNGRTLCVDCHRKTDSYGNRNKVYGLSRNSVLLK